MISAISATGLNEPADEENDKPELDMSIKVGSMEVPTKALVCSLQRMFTGSTDGTWRTVHWWCKASKQPVGSGSFLPLPSEG
jgi:hypothetical protein